MKRQKTDRLLLTVSLTGYLIMSVSFLLMPVERLGKLPGILFWISLALGAAMQMLLAARRRSFFAQYGVTPKKMQKKHNGLMSFFSNPHAKLVDKLLPVGLIGTVLAFVLTRGTGYICYILIAVTVYLLCLHCILNGRIYVHVQNQNKIQQVLEQKKARNTHSKGEGDK